MAGELLTEYGSQIETLTLVPGSGGVHEVEIDGDLVFSKKELGRHPTVGELKQAIQERQAT